MIIHAPVSENYLPENLLRKIKGGRKGCNLFAVLVAYNG